MITKLKGQVIGDMTAESRRMTIKRKRTEPKDPTDPQSALMEDTIEEAYEKHDWLYMLEAAMVMHLREDCTIDAAAVSKCQELLISKYTK
jgi:hypothetical protein